MKKKKHKQSAEIKSPETSSQMLQQPSLKSTTSLNLYRGTSKITLDKFLDCLYDKDYQVLIISGTATDDELREAWEAIYAEFCNTSGSTTYNELYETVKAIKLIRAKILLAEGIVEHLQLCYNSELVEILKKLMLRCTLKASDKPGVMVTKLNSVVAKIKNWYIDLQKRQDDFDKLQKENVKKDDRGSFDTMLDQLSEYYKYHVSATEITVARFLSGIKRMNEYYTQLTLKQKNGNRTGQ